MLGLDMLGSFITGSKKALEGNGIRTTFWCKSIRYKENGTIDIYIENMEKVY